jgi:hypothetical protein
MTAMTKFILIFTLAFSVALLFTYYTKSLAAPIFQELLSAFVVLTLITGTLSYALHAYVDSVSKDVFSDGNNKDKNSYNTVIESLTELKKEILVNAFAVVGLLVLERIAHGFSLIFPVSSAEPFNWPWACAISVRVACFTLSLFIAAIQFRGFIIANEYRSVISRGK